MVAQGLDIKLDINLLGQMEVCWNDQELTFPEAEAKLLAWLALNRNREIKDQDLADIFFPGSVAGDKGRSSVGKLKKSLYEHLCPQIGQSRSESQKSRQIYDVFFKEALSTACIDVIQFDALNRRPDTSSKMEALRFALRGSFLEGWKDAWIVSERERIEKKIALLRLDLKRELPKTFASLLEQEEYEKGYHLVEQVIALDAGNDLVWKNLLGEKQTMFQHALHEQRTHPQAGAKQQVAADSGLEACRKNETETEKNLNSAPSDPRPSYSSASAQEAEQNARQAGGSVPFLTRPAKGIAASSKRGVALVGAALLLLGAVRLATNHHTAPPSDAAQDKTKAKVSVEAERFYEKGRSLWETRSYSELEQAKGWFQRAIKLKPDQASYNAGLADTYSMLCFYGYAAPKETLPKALKSAHEAVNRIRTPPEKTEAYASLAFAEMLNWEWDNAEQHFLAAGVKEGRHGVDAALARAYQWHSLFNLVCRKGRYSQRDIEDALKHSPDSKAINLSSGRRDYYDKNFTDAKVHFKEMLERFPNDSLIYCWLGLCYEGSGENSQAKANLEKAALESKPEYINVLGALGHFYAKSGNTPQAQAILNKLKTRRSVYVSPVAIAVIYMGLYDHASIAADKAKYKTYLEDYLNAGLKGHASDMLLLHVDPRFASIQHDPWFLSLMGQVLPAQ